MRAQPRAQGRKAARDKGGQVRLRQHNREQRATEQAEARQARLHKTGKLIDEEGKLEDSLSLNKPACQLYKMSGYRESSTPFMPNLCHCSCCNESFPSIKLTSRWLCVAAAHGTKRNLNSIQLETTWIQVQCHQHYKV